LVLFPKLSYYYYVIGTQDRISGGYSGIVQEVA
jgi:hypothetical protein